VNKDFESIGLNLLKSIRQFVQLEAELEKEYTNTKGWLKKKVLDKLSSTDTRDKFNEENNFGRNKINR